MMDSCCCIYFIEWCGFYFVWFGISNLFKWFWKSINKKKENERGIPVLRWPGGPLGRSVAVSPAVGPSCPFLPRLRRMGRPKKTSRAFPPFSFRWRVGAACQSSSSPRVVTEPNSWATTTDCCRYNRDFLPEYDDLELQIRSHDPPLSVFHLNREFHHVKSSTRAWGCWRPAVDRLGSLRVDLRSNSSRWWVRTRLLYLLVLSFWLERLWSEFLKLTVGRQWCRRPSPCRALSSGHRRGHKSCRGARVDLLDRLELFAGRLVVRNGGTEIYRRAHGVGHGGHRPAMEMVTVLPLCFF
jgi:hypothetical protein